MGVSVEQTVISADRVLAGRGGQMISPGAVLIDGDTITAVGTPQSLLMLLRREAVRLDYPGATVMPGLIDAHVHLAFTAGRDPLTALRDPAGLPGVMAEHARQLLDAGVTTVRDLGDRDYLALELETRIATGQLPGPRVITAGAPVTSRGGHCWFLGGEVDTSSQIRDLIARHAERGVNWIKVMASGGNITPNSPAVWQSQFSDAQLREIVAAATERGLPVAAHAHSTAATTAAVAAGAASIEHCRWMTSASYGDPHLCADTAAAMVRQGTVITPTITTHYGLGEDRRPGYVEHQTRVLQWQDAHGIRIMSGTDVGASPYEFYAQHRYLKAYQLAGFSNRRILDLLTRDTAAGLGLADQIGTLGHGYSADVLVVAGNPLDDLDALRHPLLVLVRGRRHQPGTAHDHRAPNTGER
jgi:imidazolonepropionase-like amidohydrolase